MGNDPSYTDKSTGTGDPVQNVSWYKAIAFCNKLSILEGLEEVYSISGIDFTSLTYGQIPTIDDSLWNSVTADWSKNGYRLPSEMEWQWAAMGAKDNAAKQFAGHDGSNKIGDYAVFGYGSGEEGATLAASSAPCGTKLPNELDIYDMSGNIFEYCWDIKGNYPGGVLDNYHGASSGANRVCRGGSWTWPKSQATVSYRASTGMPGSGSVMGFRVARK